MAAVMPHTTPWTRPLRGTSDGVNDRHANNSAPQQPGRVTCRHRGASGRDGTAAGTSAGALGAGTEGTGAAGTSVTAGSDIPGTGDMAIFSCGLASVTADAWTRLVAGGRGRAGSWLRRDRGSVDGSARGPDRGSGTPGAEQAHDEQGDADGPEHETADQGRRPDGGRGGQHHGEAGVDVHAGAGVGVHDHE